MDATAHAAIVTDVAGPVEVRAYPVPRPGPGQFVLEVELCGMCGTDAHVYRGRLASVRFPALLGHEIVGRLAALGDGVEADHAGSPVAVGDRVGVFPALSCGRCFECQVRRRPGDCPRRRPSYGFASPADRPPYLTGGFATHLYASNAGTVFYRTDLPAEVAVLQEPLSVALHGVERSAIRIGSTVVVQGVGAIGLMAVVAARVAGAAKVVAVGAPGARLELAARLGADTVVTLEEGPAGRRRAIFEALGREGADAVIGTAGSPESFAEALALVADGGVLAELGNFTDRGSIAFNPYSDLLKRDITIAGVYGAGPDMQRRYHEALTILERGGRPYERVVSHRVPLGRVREALEALGSGYALDGRDVVKLAIDPSA
ncbi:MAG: alcohol dehydrogenase catalytic domain-containing protein [Nonomuraea sp.]|nr:alcohol dehydrogenase catalytic domain-containing protein [Nonomuraea sp.]NUP62683.1 alcohol dehydrogenase catalytic domain-containing protein [Nonomuraea sp.]NUP79773.1 alcohol dehydrogenase catalytic domain-containing protein [Nonomuraea sp.]NUS09664.1 alcohol dehydrogenase catalytic domain-containing protein [Nonomuraea sp.]